MKIFQVFLLLLLPFVYQNADDAIDKTAEHIKAGKVQELSKTFAATVDITIKGVEDNYSAAKAEEVLTNFFQQNQPRAVNILHRVTSNPNYRFAVLILNTSNGNYRISFNLKNEKSHFELSEITIESEK